MPKKSIGSQLAALRWKKEKPDPEYFKRIRQNRKTWTKKIPK